MPTSSRLRARYFSNRFVQLIRTELRFDQREWEDLRDCLRDLANEWADAREVDKDLIQDLFALPTIVRGVDADLPRDSALGMQRLDERATELEAWILQALR